MPRSTKKICQSIRVSRKIPTRFYNLDNINNVKVWKKCSNNFIGQIQKDTVRTVNDVLEDIYLKGYLSAKKVIYLPKRH